MSSSQHITLPDPAVLLTAEDLAMVDSAAELSGGVITVQTTEAAVEAREILEEIHGFSKVLDTRREQAKAPFLEAGRVIDKTFKPALNKLDLAMCRIKNCLTSWDAQVRERRAAAEREAEQIQSMTGRAVAPITPAVMQASEDAKVVKTREFTEVEIEDLTLIPRDYLTPDMVKIRAAAAAGLAIPGVKISKVRRAIN